MLFDNGYGIVKCDYDDIVDEAVFLEEGFDIGPFAIKIIPCSCAPSNF